LIERHSREAGRGSVGPEQPGEVPTSGSVGTLDASQRLIAARIGLKGGLPRAEYRDHTITRHF